MSKKDLGRGGNRGASNRRIWVTNSGPPVQYSENDLWLPEEYVLIDYVKRPDTYTHNSNTSMVSDAYITFTLPEDGIFNIDFYAAVSGPTGADIDFDWAVTGGLAQESTRACFGPGLSVASGDADDCACRATKHNLSTDVGYGTDNSQTSNIHEHFLVETSGGAGTLTLRHAQRTSDPGDTNVSPNTYAICTQIGGTKSSIMRYDAGWNRII
jgi:hypothetical protein